MNKIKINLPPSTMPSLLVISLTEKLSIKIREKKKMNNPNRSVDS